jgi:hypothetical protein
MVWLLTGRQRCSYSSNHSGKYDRDNAKIHSDDGMLAGEVYSGGHGRTFAGDDGDIDTRELQDLYPTIRPYHHRKARNAFTVRSLNNHLDVCRQREHRDLSMGSPDCGLDVS